MSTDRTVGTHDEKGCGMGTRQLNRGWAGTWGVLLLSSGVAAAEPSEWIAAIKSVGVEGQGHAAAVVAVRNLSGAEAAVLPEILAAFDGASPLAANWLRGAFEAVADRAWRQQQLSAPLLEGFVTDTRRDPAARRMAYEWLLKLDATASERLVPGFLHDPSPELRREAVARQLSIAEEFRQADQRSAAIAAYRRALSGAVDDDQVKAIVKPLRELGEQVDLPRHFGFLLDWQLIGPFDNTGNQGFDTPYPPEQGLDFAGSYAGKTGEISWQDYRTDHEYGIVDLTKALAPHKGAVTYAAAEFASDRPQTVEIRLGTPNAWKLWLNGQLLFARDEYHRNMQIDQYRVKAPLKAGRNVILLKVCQNEQTEEWAQRWQFQLRVCDATGAALPPAAPATSQR